MSRLLQVSIIVVCFAYVLLDKPQIRSPKARVLKVKKGDQVQSLLTYRGGPSTHVQWKFNDKDLRRRNDVKLINGRGKSILKIGRATRKHNGLYRMFAENEEGQDQVLIKVVVLDVPDKPQDPIASITSRKKAKLKWKAPVYDGNSPIKTYTVEKLVSHRSWSLLGETKNLEMDIKGIHPGSDVIIRLMAHNDQGKSKPIVMKFRFLVADFPTTTPGAPGIPQLMKSDGENLRLMWMNPVNNGGEDVTGYTVEQKDAWEGEEWRKSIEVEGDVTDTYIYGLVQGKSYAFRVLASNKKGLGDPSEPSDVYTAKEEDSNRRAGSSDSTDSSDSSDSTDSFDSGDSTDSSDSGDSTDSSDSTGTKGGAKTPKTGETRETTAGDEESETSTEEGEFGATTEEEGFGTLEEEEESETTAEEEESETTAEEEESETTAEEEEFETTAEEEESETATEGKTSGTTAKGKKTGTTTKEEESETIEEEEESETTAEEEESETTAEEEESETTAEEEESETTAEEEESETTAEGETTGPTAEGATSAGTTLEVTTAGTTPEEEETKATTKK